MKLFHLLVCLCILTGISSQKLILPGSHPDPSIVKIKDKFWISTTSSNWLPAFPLFQSSDLTNWEPKGYIFEKPPAWADYYFWAPEITYDSGKVYVYYTAHKKGGSFCLGVASADKPEGPYKDHGPIICQALGAIDGFAVRDTTGKLYLIWKEDANSVNAPTPVWASEMNEERTALIGEKFELFRNDEEWEKNLVEGVAIIKHEEFYYAFYAAAGCCGTRCSYVTGVARSRSILGPWKKFKGNPILTDDARWICKGHGTAIKENDRYYFIYHAYDRQSNAFTGREGLIQEFTFTKEGWPKFIPDNVENNEKKREVIEDNFDNGKLGPAWQWNVFNDVQYEIENGRLHLAALPTRTGRFIGRRSWSTNYTANVEVYPNKSKATAGLAVIGNEKNLVAVTIKGTKISVVHVESGKESVIESIDIPVTEMVYLQVQVKDRFRVSFSYSLDGNTYNLIVNDPLIATFLPPWDSPPRVGLMSKGNQDESAVFDRFAYTDSITTIVRKARKEEKKINWIFIISGVFLAGAIVWYSVQHMFRKNADKKVI